MREYPTTVRTAAGELRALVTDPQADRSLPGIVLVDGSGDGTADGWRHWPSTVADCGAVVLTHDKPGCGGSPGSWRVQSLEDRARESLAAVEVLRRQPGVDPGHVGVLGISQGGWVCYLAAAMADGALRHAVAVSGPGVSPGQQEHYRLGLEVDHDPAAMAWVEERSRRLAAGQDVEAVLTDQQRHADQLWYEQVSRAYDTVDGLEFIRRVCRFDPAEVLPRVGCPLFAAFGASDTSVPVRASVAVLNDRLPADPRHALGVYPGADHNLYVADPAPGTPRADQLAPGFTAMLTGWLASV